MVAIAWLQYTSLKLAETLVLDTAGTVVTDRISVDRTADRAGDRRRPRTSEENRSHHAYRRIGGPGHRCEPGIRATADRAARRAWRGEGLRCGQETRNNHHRGCVPIRIDITDPASVAAAAAAATDVNLLINNAGKASFNGLLTGPLDDIREQMEIHYFGTLTVTRAFAPHPANFGAYSAAKAAEWAQTDVVRDELAPSGVAVTARHVGYMDTDIIADVDAPKQDPAAVAAAALDGVETGLVEVLIGDRARQVKAGLAADRGAVAPAH
jgi:NAD(P)-dependent dehydrogenase (short-subunit alcohol dehydrogenase family)